ncbi:MAG TPA: ABC transporter substrate-binding protein [Phycisphaerales bacterium]|nr:ABC transporter substrate-binding protein [Phycisphaerales bacterium]
MPRSIPRFSSLCLILACFILCALMSSCDRNHNPSSPSRSPQSQPDAQSLRIVSLSPAISRTLLDLGLASFIVGRTPFCSSIDQSIPVVGDLNSIDYERLTKLNPTHILVQPPSTGLDPHLQSLADEHHWIIHSWKLNTLADINQLIHDLPEICKPADPSLQAKTVSYSADLSQHLSRLMSTDQSAGASRQTVLLVHQTQPVGVFGIHTYLDELLHHTSYTNVVAAPGWIELSLEDVQKLNPAVIILVFPNQSTDVDPMSLLGPLRQTSVDAVKNHRVGIITDADSLLPSTSFLEVSRELDSALSHFSEPAP